MTAPRRVIPGTTYLLTRRCARRQLLLRPSAIVNQIILFCIAFAAKRTGMVIHAVVALSNHIHIVLTDPEGRIPEFTQWLFEYTAKCRNASLGRWENLWSSDPPSQLPLESPEDILDKLLYVFTNPTAAALVHKAELWPGVITKPQDFKDGPIEVQRPEVFFRASGPMPASVNLDIQRPSGFDDMTTDEFIDMVSDELELREADIRLQHRLAGKTILGRKAVLAQDPFDYPVGMEPRRNLDPKVAAKDKWHRVELLRRNADWYLAYDEALERFQAGEHDVLFPAGTYWMVRHANASCVPPDS